MSQAVVTTLVSAVVAGVFSLIGKWVDNKLAAPQGLPNPQSWTEPQGQIQPSLQGGQVALQQTVVQPLPQPAGASVKFGTVLKHVGVIQLGANLGGLIFGYVLGPSF
jgi:hypothetical protein